MIILPEVLFLTNLNPQNTKDRKLVPVHDWHTINRTSSEFKSKRIQFRHKMHLTFMIFVCNQATYGFANAHT